MNVISAINSSAIYAKVGEQYLYRDNGTLTGEPISALRENKLDKTDFETYSAGIDDDIDYLSAAIEDSTLSAGTDLIIENNIISVNTDGTANSAYMAFVEGSATIASGKYSHAEGGKTSAIGTFTHAEGTDTKATGEESHAEGWGTFASGHNSHAEGNYTTACGYNSHAEGYNTFAGYQAHSEGDSTSAFGNHSHAEGQYSVSQNNCSHAEGQNTSALSMQTHTEGGWTVANGNAAHAEGYYTSALGYASHTEGFKTNATSSMGHAEGNITSAVGEMSHAEGSQVLAQGIQSHAEGNMTTAFGAMSHTEGVATLASGGTSHAEGAGTSALDYASHVEGYCTIAASPYMHAGGEYNKTSADALFVIGNGSAATARSDAFVVTSGGLASATILATSGIPDIEEAIKNLSLSAGTDLKIENNIISVNTNGTANSAYMAFVEGEFTLATGRFSHAEGSNTYSKGYYSHAEGTWTKAIGEASHAEGGNTLASGNYSHAEGGNTSAKGVYTHAEGYYTIAGSDYMHAGGKYNKTSSDALFVIGNGSGNNATARSDAFIITSAGIASGAEFIAGNGVSLSSLTDVATTTWVNTQIANFGGFTTANSASPDGHPDISEPNTKTIYLVKDSTVTGLDKYNEWIFTSADVSTTAWEKIGDTSIDLTQFYEKTETSSKNEISNALQGMQTALTFSYAHFD